MRKLSRYTFDHDEYCTHKALDCRDKAVEETNGKCENSEKQTKSHQTENDKQTAIAQKEKIEKPLKAMMSWNLQGKM